MLPCCNNKQKQYNDILFNIPFDFSGDLIFNTGGKLIVCLIEFRPVEEIKHVMHALLRSYKPEEIGVAIMFGNKNKNYIEETFKDWKNIILIHKNYDNIDRRIYSGLMKQPEYYEHFSNWSHVLVYQTDALLLRKIDDIYFEYDYIGAPWIESNQWCRYNAGNGGFSLRNIKSTIRVTEQFRNLPFEKIPQGNEDGFYCSQDSFKYPIYNTELHKAFSVERVKYKTPVGVHQIYHTHSMTGQEWNEFLQYMKDTLVNNIKPNIDTLKLLQQAKEQVEQENIRLAIIEKLDIPESF